jgi:serine protease Do/serine protease DegQ
LVNLRGELVGINSAIFTPSGGNIGIGFAIPTAMASYVMEQLAEYGEVRRGTLGIYVQDLTPELAGALGIENTKGALVAEVIKGAAADKARIEAGDVITGVSSYPVHNMQDFYIVEGQLPIGEKERLSYLRKGKSRTATLSATALPLMDGADLDRRFAGAVFQELPAKMRAERLRGVILSELDSQSRLARFGLRTGDIITAVNRQPIQGLSEFENQVKSSRGPVLLQLRRNGEDYVARVD